MKYVALLRGINVGGKNKVSMLELKSALVKAGLQDVASYTNSGNIIFSHTEKSETKLAQLLEKTILEHFGFAVKVLVKSRTNYARIVKAIPNHYTDDADMKCDVLFLWDKYTAADAAKTLPVKEGLDTVIVAEGAIIWGLGRANATRSGLSKMIGTDLYAHVTIRNCNTSRKLLVLLDN